MVAFQWAVPCGIWSHGSWITRFLRIQSWFEQALSHYLCSKICPSYPYLEGSSRGGLREEDGLKKWEQWIPTLLQCLAAPLIRETVGQYCSTSQGHHNLQIVKTTTHHWKAATSTTFLVLLLPISTCNWAINQSTSNLCIKNKNSKASMASIN